MTTRAAKIPKVEMAGMEEKDVVTSESTVVMELDAMSQGGVALGARSVTFSRGVAELTASGI